MIECGILSVKNGPKSLLEIGFDGSQRKRIMDFRPHLPLVFQLRLADSLYPPMTLRAVADGQRACVREADYKAK
jgi:hypothetical protein